jgi:serine/threonine-protein kinase
MDKRIGRTIRHYKILERLGSGGMGVVYRAEDTRLERIVALKFLPASLSRDPVAKSRFMQEARAASALDHPNICNIHSIEETEDGQIFIVMAYYEGETVKQKLERGPLPLAEAVDIALRVVEGLARAHESHIVHRDIKPANVIRTNDGGTKILDFGMAKLAAVSDIVRSAPRSSSAGSAGDVDATKTDAFMGTPVYMSPEQTRREPVDRRTDIWSVGVILYEMTTGRRPFEGKTAASVARAILRIEPEPLTASRPEAPEALREIVGKAMVKRPEQRYQHLDNMLVDLRMLHRQLEGPGATRSLAVLPFANLSADVEQEYFCDGMAEEIINALTHVEGLRVVPQTSSFAFKGKQADVREIGRKLNVAAVLDGSVRTSGNRLRIVAKLINATDGYQIWSESYDREMEDVFAIQEEIAQAIVNAHPLQLLGQRIAPRVRRHTQDLQAYTLYLKGRFHWSKRTEEELNRGIDYFEQAIARDPGYALAYAGVADCYNMLGFYCALPPGDSFPKAKSNAVKALELNDGLAEAHTSLAFATLLYDWDWSSAEKGFLRAIDLKPDYPTSHHWYSEYLLLMGRTDEALAAARTVLESDPLSLLINTLMGWAYYYSRDFDCAVTKLEEVLELEPQFVPAHLWLGLAQLQRSESDRAVATFQKAVEISEDSPLMFCGLGRAYAVSGKASDAEMVLDWLEVEKARSYVPSYYVAAIHAGLGRTDETFAWLDKARDRHDHWLVYLNVDPIWDGLRADPRFAELARRIGLPCS